MTFDQTSKYVPSTIVVGPYGQSVVTRGYTEIAGLRIYDDQVVVGAHGQYETSKGWSEVNGLKLGSTDRWNDQSDDNSTGQWK